MTAIQVGERLGLARETARKMVADAIDGKEVKVKLTVSLAMSALAQGLKPWDQYER